MINWSILYIYMYIYVYIYGFYITGVCAMTYWLFALGAIRLVHWSPGSVTGEESFEADWRRWISASDWQFQAIPKIWVIGDHRPYERCWKYICLELSNHHLSWDILQSTCAAMDTAIFTGSLDSSLQLVLFKQMVLWGFAHIGAPPARSLELVSESSYLLCFIYLDLSFSPFLPWPQATYLSIQPVRPAHTSGYGSHRKITRFSSDSSASLGALSDACFGTCDRRSELEDS